MGFWGNLFEGAKSAGQWALDHSGQIAGVVSTVAKVAGVLVPADHPEYKSLGLHVLDVEDGTKNLGKFHKRFAVISKTLNDKAKEAVKNVATTLRLPSDVHPDDVTKTTGSVVGLWRNPVGLAPDNHTSQMMYEDMSKLLGSLEIPTSLTSKGKVTRDLADLLGESLFVGLGTDEKHAQDNDLVKTKKTQLKLGDGSIIRASHVYYKIPMGKGGRQDSVHSAIYVEHEAADEDVARLEKELSAVTFSHALDDSARWIVSLNIQWANAILAKNIQATLLSDFKTKYASFKIQSSMINGTLQLLKVTAPPTYTPADVQAAVRVSASAAVNPPPKDGVQGRTAGDFTRNDNNVSVEVTDSSFVEKDDSAMSTVSEDTVIV